MARLKATSNGSSGCLSLIVTCLATCALIVVNAALSHLLLGPLVAFFPDALRRPKIEQGLLFVLPVLLTVLQWWLVDWAFFWARLRSSPDASSDETRRDR